MRLVGVPVGKEMATVTACPLPGIVSLHVSKVARVAGVALVTVFVTMIQVLSFKLMAGAVELSTLLALFVGELNVDVLKTSDIYQARRSRCSKTQSCYLHLLSSYLFLQMLYQIICSVKAVRARGTKPLYQHVLQMMLAGNVPSEGQFRRELAATKLADVAFYIQA